MSADRTVVGWPTRILLAAVFLLFGIPYAGRPPLYVVDVLLAGLWVWILAFAPNPKQYWRRIPAYVKWVAGSIAYLLCISTIHEMLTLKIYAASIYMAGRYLLALGLILLVPMLLRSPSDIYRVSGLVVLAAALTSVFAVMFSLPGFSFVRVFYASPSIFFPGRAAMLNDAHVFTDSYVDRASALVGGANIVACWLTVSVGFVFVRLRRSRSAIARVALLSLVGFICFASLLTYSRVAFVGLGFVGLMAIFFAGKEIRMYIPIFVAGLSFFVLNIANDSSSFNFSYTFSKFQYLVSDPGSAYSDQARIRSYTYTIPFLIDNPQYLFIGQGMGGDSAVRHAGKSKEDLILNFDDGRVHSVFAKGTYNLGLLGTALLFVLYFRSIVLLYRSCRVSSRYRWEERDVFAALLVSVCALFPFMLVGHVFISQPMGFALVFLFVGLAEAVWNMSSQRIRSRRGSRVAAAHNTRS